MNQAERTLRRIDDIQQRHRSLSFAFAVFKRFGEDNAVGLTVQLTYAMFVTVFPLLLLLVTVLSIVLAGNSADYHRVLHSALADFPIIGQQLANGLHALKRSSSIALAVALIGLLYGCTRLAQVGLYAMEQVWRIPIADRPNFIKRMARSGAFLAILGVDVVLTTILSGFGTFGRHNVWLGALGEVLSFALNVVLTLAIFHVLTPKSMSWRRFLPGSIFAGFAWTALLAAGGYVVGHDLKGASALYGTFGFVLGLLAWISLGAQVFLYAAEINVVVVEHLWPRSMLQPPLTEADQRSLAAQAQEHQYRPEQFVTTGFTEAAMTEQEYREQDYQVAKSDQATS
jgi:YihY family inner membrane protein